MTEPNMVECPVDGCDYTGLPDSVKAHYSGKQDTDHKGGYRKAAELLDGEPNTTETDSGSTDGESGSSEPNSPTFPEAEGKDSDGSETATETAQTCPECGADTDPIPAGTVAQTEEYGPVKTEAGDRYCPECDVIISADGKVVR